MTSFIKKNMGIFLNYSGLGFLLRKKGRKNPIVLMYHRINNPNFDFGQDQELCVSKKNFEQQIKYMKENYNIISVDEFFNHINEKKPFKKNTVLITFDDGYLDNYKNAYPILKKYKVPALLFITTGYIENNKTMSWWDKVSYILKKTIEKKLSHKYLGSYDLTKNKVEIIKQFQRKLKKLNSKQRDEIVKELEKILKVKLENDRVFMTWDELKKMTDIFTIGSHTVSHKILPNEIDSVVMDEISESKKVIKNKFGKCDYFSYPNGDYNEAAVKSLRKSNYKLAFICKITKINLDTNPFLLPRTYVSGDENINDFKAKLLGIDNLFLSLKNGIKSY